MAKGSASSSHVASCTDYNSDDGELPDTRKQANVAAKRSGGLGKDSPAMTPTASSQQRPIPDRSSDSGYSSRTQVTDASADFARSSKGAEHASTVTSEMHTAASSDCGSRELDTVTIDGRKYKKCADPNCPKRHKSKKSKAPKGDASSTKATTSSSKRQPSPNPAASRQRQPAPEPTRPQLRPRAASDNNPRPQSFHQGMPNPYYPQGRPPVAYYRSGYPMHPAAGQMGYMIPNRTIMERPGLPRIATEFTARGPRSAGPYGRPVIRQDKPKTVLSARTPAEPKYREYATESDEDDDDEDNDAQEQYSDELARKLQRFEAHQKAAEAERRRKAEFDAMARAMKAQRDAMVMPPPLKPASVLKPTLSMRQPSASANPKVTYGTPIPAGYGNMEEQVRNLTLNSRPPLNTMGASLKVPYSTPAVETRAYLSAEAAQLGHNRRRSMYGGETISDLETHHQTLIARGVELAQQHEAQRRLAQAETSRGYGQEPLRDPLRRGSWSSVDDTTPRKTESNIRQAQTHIEKSRSQATQGQVHPLTEGSLREAGVDRQPSQRTKRSSKDGSSTAGARRPSTTTQSQVESLYDADGFKMKINPNQPYEFDLGNQRVELRPSDGGMEFVYVGGKRETPYHSTNGSTTTGSKLGRRTSQRKSRYRDDEESVEAYDDRKSRRNDPRRRAESESSRRTDRVPSREDRYRGPPMYGVSPDEYSYPTQTNGYSQGRQEPPSPRQVQGGYGGGMKQNFPGFGA